MSAIAADRMQQVQVKFAEVLSRSATDSKFRQELLTDSRAALSSHFGTELPESAAIRFVDPAGVATIVLPEVATAELSDSQLETVAGGLIPALIGAGAAMYLLYDHIANG